MKSPFIVCIFAHYHPKNQINQACLKYLNSLKEIADEIIFISTSKLPVTETDKIKQLCKTIKCRENMGLDFGSYKLGLSYVDTSITDYLILANDSVYGPIYPLQKTLDKAIRLNSDVFGITLSDEKERHLQSFFLIFNQRVITSDSFNAFWQNVDSSKNKSQIILDYEIGLSQQLLNAGFTLNALYEIKINKYLKILLFILKTQYGYKFFRFKKLIYKMQKGKDLGFNPMHLMAYNLVKKHKIPFIKKELIEKNPYQIKLSKSLLKLVAPLKNEDL